MLSSTNGLCQQVRRNILQNLLSSRFQFYSEVFVLGNVSSRTNALSWGQGLRLFCYWSVFSFGIGRTVLQGWLASLKCSLEQIRDAPGGQGTNSYILIRANRSKECLKPWHWSFNVCHCFQQHGGIRYWDFQASEGGEVFSGAATAPQMPGREGPSCWELQVTAMPISSCSSLQPSEHL